MPFCCTMSVILEETLLSRENRTTYCQFSLKSPDGIEERLSGLKSRALGLFVVRLAASLSKIPVIVSCKVLPSGQFSVIKSPAEIPVACANADESAASPTASGNSPERKEPKYT